MAVNTKNLDLIAAKASAREAALTRKTCEGCVLLRVHPRPMCSGEKSPHFRTARDTYHDRCQWYSVRGQDGKPKPVEPPAPEPAPQPKAKRMRLVKVRGSERVVTETEYDRLMARNYARKVRG